MLVLFVERVFYFTDEGKGFSFINFFVALLPATQESQTVVNNQQCFVNCTPLLHVC